VWHPEPLDPTRRTLHVGPAEKLNTLSQAARKARDGDAILIEAGDYIGDTTSWTQRDLLIRGVNGRPKFIASGRLSEDKAIWVIKGANVTVENVEFTGARVPDRNGAGIRAEGENLTVRASVFRDNENGILTNNDQQGTLLIEFTEFADNGAGDGYSHNIYVGDIDGFVMRSSFSHGARSGHLVKSRARRNVVEYNVLIDKEGGSASYELEFPSGGEALVLGNVIVQSASSENSTIVSYSAETADERSGRLILASNTIVSERSRGVYLANHSSSPVVSINNIFSGASSAAHVGRVEATGDKVLGLDDFRSATTGDFRLTSSGARKAQLLVPMVALPPDQIPRLEPGYGESRASRTRPAVSVAGAFEPCQGLN
jgi:hypothetical protein